jgi:hypothetical protein
MSTETPTVLRKTIATGLAVTLLVLVVAVGLLLREHAPGNMGTGFLGGAAVGAVVAGVGLWRMTRRPDRVSTFERAWTRTGDERDDAILTRALAVVGLASLPLVGTAAIAVGLGALPEMVLTLLLVALVLVGVVAFAVINRRS